MIGPHSRFSGRAFWAEWLRLLRLEAEAIDFWWDAREVLRHVHEIRCDLHWWVNEPRRGARRCRKDAAWWREREALWSENLNDEAADHALECALRADARALEHDDDEAFYRALRDELTVGARAIESWVRQEKAREARVSALLARLPG
jgi:hypothetical protein